MSLTRSRENVVFSGLLGGVGEYFNIDPTIVRIIVVVLFFTVTQLPIVPLYVLGAIFIPKAPIDKERSKEKETRRQRVNRAFKKSDQKNQESFTETNTIEEDDWSDF